MVEAAALQIAMMGAMDHLTLYERLMWDAIKQDEDVAWIDDSLFVDGRMCTMVKDGRIVLRLDEDRVAKLVAQGLGVVYQGVPTRDWLVVDPRVDEATVRELFGEATADRNVPRAAIARFVKEIGAEIRALPVLSDPDWDTYSMVAEVSGGSVRVAAFRYTETGSPVPTTAPQNDDLIWDLHGKTFGGDGRPWDLVLVKIRRDAPGARVTFSSGEAADAWRVNPENMARLPESLRWLPGELPEPRQPSVVANIWLTPGNVSTIKASAGAAVATPQDRCSRQPTARWRTAAFRRDSGSTVAACASAPCSAPTRSKSRASFVVR